MTYKIDKNDEGMNEYYKAYAIAFHDKDTDKCLKIEKELGIEGLSPPDVFNVLRGGNLALKAPPGKMFAKPLDLAKIWKEKHPNG